MSRFIQKVMSSVNCSMISSLFLHSLITSNVSSCPEVAGDAAILVPPADSTALVHAIQDVLENPVRARELGMAGYKRVQAHFTWQKAAEKTIDAYREVIRDYRRF